MNPFNKKYELLNIATKLTNGTVVRRIQALQDITNSEGVTIARAGELGGWIESERNLSHSGGAWVSDTAVVSGRASVLEDAVVNGNARVSGEACITNQALVTGNAWVTGHTVVAGSAIVGDSSRVLEYAKVTQGARLYDTSVARGMSRVGGTVYLTKNNVASGFDLIFN